ncbi:MAG: PQQ-binding-like beta-propeller repeat protein [Actinomycetota bacterium]
MGRVVTLASPASKADTPTPSRSGTDEQAPRPAVSGRPNLLKQGTVLQSRYRIQDVLGIGGMSTVYRARDLRFPGVERLCAVKEMFNVGEDTRLREMRLTNFQREAALLATLTHHSIPRIYDFFEHHDTIYLVLELIRGHDLESLLNRRGEPFPQDTVVNWALELTDVLSYLHHQTPEPIIFRDLKPSNVMVRDNGSLALVDFGIARSFAPSQKGTMIGTEGYAPPEQYRGIADVRGDVYAFGATLHHLVTGSDPRGETPFTFAQRPPRRLNPAVTPEFEQHILKCVAYSPSDRYGSMDEVRAALLALRDERPRTVGAVEASRRTGAGGSQILSLPSRGTAEALTAKDQERLDWTVASADEIRGSASHAGGAVYVGSYDAYLYAIDETDGTVRWRFRAQRGIVSRPLPLGDLVVFGSEDHNVYGVSRQHGRAIWSFRTNMPVRSSASGDDKACIIGSDDGFLYRIDRAKGTMLWRYRSWGPIRSTPIVASGGAVFGSDDGYLYCVDQDSGQLRWRRQVGAAIVSSAALADRTLIVGAADGAIRGFDLDTSAVLWTHETGKAIVASPVVVDQTAYVGSADGGLYALDVATGSVSWKAALCRQITSTATPDGEFLYVGGTDGVLYCVNRADGAVKWTFTAGGPVVSKPLVTADHIIFGSMDGKLYAIHRTT